MFILKIMMRHKKLTALVSCQQYSSSLIHAPFCSNFTILGTLDDKKLMSNKS